MILLRKDEYNSKLKNIDDKIPSNLATTTALIIKINEAKNKIPIITNLATTNALTAVEIRILNVSSLVKKTD